MYLWTGKSPFTLRSPEMDSKSEPDPNPNRICIVGGLRSSNAFVNDTKCSASLQYIL